MSMVRAVTHLHNVFIARTPYSSASNLGEWVIGAFINVYFLHVRESVNKSAASAASLDYVISSRDQVGC